MNRVVHLFADFTPNTPGDYYYFPTTQYEYQEDGGRKILNAMIAATADRHTVLGNANTYKIYDDIITIADNFGVIVNPLNITYCVIDTEINLLFYKVINVKPVPQGYQLTIELDNWATYISVAHITRVVFNKSNAILRQQQGDIYLTEEEYTALRGKKYYREITNTLYTNTQLRFLAILEVTQGDALTATTRIVPVTFDPLEYEGSEGLSVLDIRMKIEAMNVLVQNIYEVTEIPSGKAQIKKLYMIPVITSSDFGDNWKFKSVTRNGTQRELKGKAITSFTGIYEKDIAIINSDKPENYTEFKDSDGYATAINAVGATLYAGGKYNGLKLPNFVGGYMLKLIFEVKQDELKVKITDGEESRDLTDMFSLPAVVNTATLTSLETIGKTLEVVSNISGGVFQIANGGAGIVSGTTQVASTFVDLTTQKNGSYLAGGDASVTFSQIIKEGSGNIFYISILEALNQNTPGRNKVREFGARCAIMIAPNFDIREYLPKENIKYLLTATYNLVIACSAYITNVPKEIIADLTATLESGIKIKWVN